MAKRDIIDVSSKAALFYLGESAGEYLFVVNLQSYLEVLETYELEIATSFISLLNNPHMTVAQVLSQVKLVIGEGEEVPYYTTGGLWACPELIKFDRATAPVHVNPNGYIAASVISWIIPSFISAIVYYKPVGEEFTLVPESLPDYDKQTLAGNAAVFCPSKGSNYFQDEFWVSERHSIYNYSKYLQCGAWVYHECDLEDTHIVRRATNYIYLNTEEPNFWCQQPSDIFSCYDDREGYNIGYHSYAGGNLFVLYIDPYRTGVDLPIRYYPPREEIEEPGRPTNFLPILPAILYLLHLGHILLGKEVYVSSDLQVRVDHTLQVQTDHALKVY
jgi:hypothetical protein